MEEVNLEADRDAAMDSCLWGAKDKAAMRRDETRRSAGGLWRQN